MLKVQGLEKSFELGSGRLSILSGIDISIDQGSSLAIVGKSGSGKSTLLSLLAGLSKPDSGQVIIGDISVSDQNEVESANFRSKNIGFVFQQFHLIPHLNAIENVALPLQILSETQAQKRMMIKEIEDKAISMIEEVGLGERLHHRVEKLSGGEQQRLAIARAFVHEPQVVFADEPSGNLDEQTGEKIVQLIFDRVKKQGTTLVLVTHDLGIAQKCDRTVVLTDGRLVDA